MGYKTLQVELQMPSLMKCKKSNKCKKGQEHLYFPGQHQSLKRFFHTYSHFQGFKNFYFKFQDFPDFFRICDKHAFLTSIQSEYIPQGNEKNIYSWVLDTVNEAMCNGSGELVIGVADCLHQVYYQNLQESCAIAKMTARCALYK